MPVGKGKVMMEWIKSINGEILQSLPPTTFMCLKLVNEKTRYYGHK